MLHSQICYDAIGAVRTPLSRPFWNDDRLAPTGRCSITELHDESGQLVFSSLQGIRFVASDSNSIRRAINPNNGATQHSLLSNI